MSCGPQTQLNFAESHVGGEAHIPGGQGGGAMSRLDRSASVTESLPLMPASTWTLLSFSAAEVCLLPMAVSSSGRVLLQLLLLGCEHGLQLVDLVELVDLHFFLVGESRPVSRRFGGLAIRARARRFVASGSARAPLASRGGRSKGLGGGGHESRRHRAVVSARAS